MGSAQGLRAIALLALLVLVSAAHAAELKLAKSTVTRLATLPRGEGLRLDQFPTGPTNTAALRFERVEIYAPDTHIYEITADGQKEIPRSTRIFLRGYSEDGSVRVALSLNADGSFAQGAGSAPDGAFVLHASTGAHGTMQLAAVTLQSTLPPGFDVDFHCGNEDKPPSTLGRTPPSLAEQLRIATGGAAPPAPAAATQTLRLATIAVDTDSLFMSKLFSNNTTNATDWIAGLFNTMNSMYERDLLVKLYQGTTFLCGSGCADPYSSFTPGATTTELSFFSNHWKANHASVVRNFAVLLSGQQSSTPSSCSASGIAWIDQYCQKGFTSGSNTIGSYSIDQVCTSINIDPDGSFDALFVGHEVGHNFGAYHTHCTNATTGAAPTGTNTIDKCFNTESGCYSGAASCPAAGAGTIMSYCNFTSVSHCASGTQNLLQFHPTQVTALDSLIAAQGACLNETDDIFYDGYE
jgi:hypothetical protein